MRKTVAKQWQRHFVCYNVNMENIKPYDMQLDLVCNYCVLNIKADFKHTIRSNNAIEFKAEIDKVFTDYLQTITEAYEDGKLSKFKYDELRLRSNMARKTYSEEVDKLIK